ncbi:Flp pilus assembly secretin CpaC [Bradyrhizobium sp. GM2.4]
MPKAIVDGYTMVTTVGVGEAAVASAAEVDKATIYIEANKSFAAASPLTSRWYWFG